MVDSFNAGPQRMTSMPSVFLGIDIGTSATKSLAVDARGTVLASASADYPLSHPKPGWSEQDPDHWWKATIATVRKLVRWAKLKGADVKGIGLSGQMHGSVFLDRRDSVVRPALLWNDQRTAAECEEITRRAGGRDALLQLVSNPALTGFTAPKILWLRNHEPRRYAQLAKVLLPKDYVRLKLTGEYATEVSDASGTLLLDIRQRTWSDPLLSRLEIDKSLLPSCFESVDVSGRLRAESARELGLAEGTPVVGGAGDQAAGAVGNGIVSSGVVSATLGTSGVVFAHSQSPAVDSTGSLHTFCHAAPGMWHQMGVVLAAGGSLQWFRNQLADDLVSEAKKRRVDPYELLTALAEEAPPGSEGLFFLPYLSGERTPHADPHARGAWIGLGPRHQRAHLVRALMEGVTFALRDSLELIRDLGVPIEQIRVSGGGARSPFWRQLQADIYGQAVVTTTAAEGPAFGVAILAMVAAGEYDSVSQACQKLIKVTGTTRPNAKRRDVYNRAYPIFRKLYQSLREDFADIARLA